MPKEPTPRLKLNNPSTGEFDWDKSWWDNTAILDNHPGIKVVTSSTLPEDPWVGQFIFNVDTHSLLVWNGSNWVDQSSGMFDYIRASSDGIKAGRVVYLETDGCAHHADYNLPEEYAFRILGIAIKDINAGECGLIKRTGLIKNPDWELTVGKEFYLGSDGKLIENRPDKGLLLSVGVALSRDSLSIRLMQVKQNENIDERLLNSEIISILGA